MLQYLTKIPHNDLDMNAYKVLKRNNLSLVTILYFLPKNHAFPKNKQNCHIWCTENPYVVDEKPMNSQIVNDWWGFGFWEIELGIKRESYRAMISNLFIFFQKLKS